MGGQNKWRIKIKKNVISVARSFGLALVAKFTVMQNTTPKSRSMPKI